MFDFYKKLAGFFEKQPWLSEIVVFLLALALYLPLQQSASFADPDSFYHLKMAELIAGHGPVRDFIWLPYTTLASNFADHHFLYHVALIPFIKILGSFSGIKLATAFFAAFAIAALVWAMRSAGVRYAAGFALAAAVMNPLVFRIDLSKASAPGVALLMIGLALALKNKTWPLGLVAFVYVWTHGGWPALLLLGTVAIAITSIRDGHQSIVIASEAKQSPRNIAVVAVFKRLLRRLWPPRNDGYKSLLFLWLGTLAGLVINPFFPQNLKFYWEQIVQIAVVNYQTTIGVGTEWYPYALPRLAHDLPLLGILVLVAIVFFPLVVSRDDLSLVKKRRTIALSVCAIIFLMMTLRSQRHVEYFVPLAVWAAAFWIGEIKAFDRRKLFNEHSIAFAIFTAAVFAMLASYAGNGLARAKKDLVGSYRFSLYQKASEYLKANTEAGEVVVHSDWDDMPSLFYWNDKNRYIIGLDPTFMYRADSGRYWDYVNFTLGRSSDPAAVMKKLKARYVVSDREHKAMDAMITNSERFERVYIDKESEIYLLK